MKNILDYVFVGITQGKYAERGAVDGIDLPFCYHFESVITPSPVYSLRVRVPASVNLLLSSCSIYLGRWVDISSRMEVDRDLLSLGALLPAPF